MLMYVPIVYGFLPEINSYSYLPISRSNIKIYFNYIVHLKCMPSRKEYVCVSHKNLCSQFENLKHLSGVCLAGR